MRQPTAPNTDDGVRAEPPKTLQAGWCQGKTRTKLLRLGIVRLSLIRTVGQRRGGENLMFLWREDSGASQAEVVVLNHPPGSAPDGFGLLLTFRVQVFAQSDTVAAGSVLVSHFAR